MTLRVLVVARGYPSYDAPGRGSFVADHVTALRSAGADVVVVSFETVQARGPMADRPAHAVMAERQWAGVLGDPAALNVGCRFGAAEVPVARLPVVRTWGALDGSEVVEMVARHRVPLLAFGRALAAREEAAGGPIDVIHAHNGLPDGAAAHALATELDVPLVVTEHDSTLPQRLRHADALRAYRELIATSTVVAVSRALGGHIASLLETDSEGRPAVPGVLPNPVPLDRFPTAGAGEERDADELLWVGARAPHKGFETLLRAFAVAHRRRPALRLRAIGPTTPEDEARWRALVGELGIADRVALEPGAPRETVAAAMRHAGLFVHPSPFETFGMVAAEALASGLPVAATPSGGVEEIIDGAADRGEVAVDGSPEALADAIERLRDRAGAIDRMALRGSIEARFAPEVIAERTLALYADARSVTARTAPRANTPPDQDPPPPPIVGAVVVATHPSGPARVAALPDGPLPVRLVRPVAASPAALRSRLLDRLTGRHDDATGVHSAGGAIVVACQRLAAESPSGRVMLVPADVEDVAPIIDAVGADAAARLAPGSLRWLGDLRDASAVRVGG